MENKIKYEHEHIFIETKKNPSYVKTDTLITEKNRVILELFN